MQKVLLLVFCVSVFPLLAVAADPPDLLLAKTYRGDIQIEDYWVSEKLDGVRAYWNGEKLLSRQGNVFVAPAWFTQGFPDTPLDGELWIARGQFEAVVSTVRKRQPVDAEWQKIRYMLFELPGSTERFSQRIQQLRAIVKQADSPYLRLIPQHRLNNLATLENKLDSVVSAGGEGLMLHHANSLYHTGRSDALLKVKRYQDAEAVVLAHLPGKGKHQGRLGALLVEMPGGGRFKIGTGFSDAQRAHPPAIGATVTYKYYGLSKNGIPRFASFLRSRDAD